MPAFGRHNPYLLQAFDTCPLGKRGSQNKLDRFFLALNVSKTDRASCEQNSERSRNILGAYTVPGSLFFIHLVYGLFLIVLDVPVHIDHAFGAFKYLHHFTGNLRLSFRVRSVYLGDESAQHRGPGRHFGDFYTGTIPIPDLLNGGPYPLGYVVALGVPFALGNKIHLYV